MTDLNAIPKDLVIKLERTMCPGACPDYSIVVHGDGRVFYQGRHYVAERGRRRGRISASKVRKIIEESYRINYFSLKDQYDAITRDGAVTKTSIRADGQTKEITNCHPSQAPEDLYHLETLIDEVVQSKRWIRDRSGQPVLDS